MDKKYRFEVPYNFADDYIETMKPYLENICIVMVQALNADCTNSREEMLKKRNAYVPTTWEDYASHIHRLTVAGFPVGILFQEDKVFEAEVIERYVDLGICAVITISDSLAQYIKLHHPHITTICSITKTLTFRDYFEKDLSMYDESVLDFPFERGLSAIQALPKTMEYNIIVNNGTCRYDCPYKKLHWFDFEKFVESHAGEGFCKLPEYNFMSKQCEPFMIFYQQDLRYFDPYIHSFKLQGREYTTQEIVANFLYFLKDDYPLIHTRAYFDDAIRTGHLQMNFDNHQYTSIAADTEDCFDGAIKIGCLRM